MLGLRRGECGSLWPYEASERIERTMKVGWAAAAVMITMLGAGTRDASAQTQAPGSPSNPFLGSVPKGTVTATPMALSAREAVERALANNLGLLLQEEGEAAARGARWRALADLLPNVSGSLEARRQIVNLEAFGFDPKAIGLSSPLVGPFPIYDARVFLSA